MKDALKDVCSGDTSPSPTHSMLTPGDRFACLCRCPLNIAWRGKRGQVVVIYDVFQSETEGQSESESESPSASAIESETRENERGTERDNEQLRERLSK